jgi:hypothetical protein
MPLKIYQEVKVQCHAFLTLALNQGKWSTSCHSQTPSRKSPYVECIEAEWILQPVLLWQQTEISLSLPGIELLSRKKHSNYADLAI